MYTTVRQLADQDYQSLSGLVAALIPHLKWRHSGLGVLQAYVFEGTTDEMRVHIWDNSLRRKGIEESGLLHDHRFDLTSHVLCGMINQVEFDLHPDPEGGWQLHSVVHAREAFAKHATNDGLVSALPERFKLIQRDRLIPAWNTYDFPKRQFHGTYLLSEFAVTLIRKSNQDEIPARILAPYGKPVVHAFADTLPESEWQPSLKRAVTILEDLRS
jgi:hypothetical protein